MTDPTLPPIPPPPANQPSAAPAYQQPSASGAAPAYGQQPYGQQPGPDRYNVLAIVSFISSFFISLVAVITGHIALSQIGKTGEKGRGLATAGLVLGYLGILGGIILLVVVVPIIFAVSTHPAHGY
jgi:hypothetical protein